MTNTFLHCGGNLSQLAQFIGCEYSWSCPEIDYLDTVILLNFADQEICIMYANELEDLSSIPVSYYPEFNLFDLLLANRNVVAKWSSTENLKKMMEYEKCDELIKEESSNWTKSKKEPSEGGRWTPQLIYCEF